jgi:hypothetical protein
MTQRPAPIRTDTSNSFAHHTIAVRLPRIIDETITLNPDFPEPICRALGDLQTALAENEPIALLGLPAPDYDEWWAAYVQHEGDHWQATEWFYAETYFYRLFMQAVRWWETQRDPFLTKKAEELTSAQLWFLLDQALAVEGVAEDKLSALIEFALWGNRIDLSHALSASHGSDIQDDDLLVDERDLVIERLLTGAGPAHLIADNAGTELAMDLVLLDALLTNGIVEETFLHLKMHPTFVSDAIVADVLAFINHLENGGHGPAAQGLGQRLRQALETGQLRLAPDSYWNSTRFLWDLPPRLAQLFQRSRLAIIKGDANYRRMVGDALWPADTRLLAVAGFFPCPLLALRTLKSDAVIGLPPGLAEKLDTIDDQWRVNGRRGVLQTTLERG